MRSPTFGTTPTFADARGASANSNPVSPSHFAGTPAVSATASNSLLPEGLPTRIAAQRADAAPPPTIDWQGSAFDSQDRDDLLSPSGWMTDFVKHLGQSESERAPNANIRLLVPSAAIKAVSDAAKRIGALFG
jgi:hypothetical protein